MKKFILDDKRFNNKTPEGLTFLQDSARIHTSKKTREALDDSEISWLQLRPKSSDLNPIEHVWGYPKNAYFECKSDFKGQKDRARLFVFVRDILESKQVEKAIKSLYDTLPVRVADLIDHNGWWSRFWASL